LDEFNFILNLFICLINLECIMRKIGFLVNPAAGMGGSVGLKGTDGELFSAAQKMGARPVSPERAVDFLKLLPEIKDLLFLVAPGVMGTDYMVDSKNAFQTLGVLNQITCREDTIRLSGMMMEQGAELIVFFGGDGTARDLFEVIGLKIPVIAVPCGVKVFSGIFTHNPHAAVEALKYYLEKGTLTDGEVLDINEDDYRQNILNSKLFGYLKIPAAQEFIQNSKEPALDMDDVQDNYDAIAEWINEIIHSDMLYFLGPGTTVKAITDSMGLQKTLLGIDASFNGTLIGEDLNETGIKQLLLRYPKRKIILTPIGGNGYIFGRGNKQFTPSVLWEIGLDNIMVVASSKKLKAIQSLRVDTGDELMDENLRGYIEVIAGFHESRMMKVV
jgi:predicted polyphosphate/ATP-dependent NAD kinase